MQIESVETKIKELREFLATDQSQEDPEGIRTKVSDVQQASLKIFEKAYKQVREIASLQLISRSHPLFCAEGCRELEERRQL